MPIVGATGPITLDETAPDGATQKVPVLDDEIQTTRSRVKTFTEVSCHPWSDQKAGQPLPGTAAPVVDTMANILALDAEEYDGRLAIDSGSGAQLVAADLGSGYGWHVISGSGPGIRPSVGPFWMTEDQTIEGVLEELIVDGDTALGAALQGDIVVPAGGSPQIRIRGRAGWFINDASSVASSAPQISLYAVVTEDPSGTPIARNVPLGVAHHSVFTGPSIGGQGRGTISFDHAYVVPTASKTYRVSWQAYASNTGGARDAKILGSAQSPAVADEVGGEATSVEAFLEYV